VTTIAPSRLGFFFSFLSKLPETQLVATNSNRGGGGGGGAPCQDSNLRKETNSPP